MKDSDVDDLETLKFALRDFANERDWERFHNPKNLVMALSGEVGELAECFQWLDFEESAALSDQRLGEVKHEIADIFLYLLILSDKLGIDPIDAAHQKLKINAEKYPASKARGNCKKYTML